MGEYLSVQPNGGVRLSPSTLAQDRRVDVIKNLTQRDPPPPSVVTPQETARRITFRSFGKTDRESYNFGASFDENLFRDFVFSLIPDGVGAPGTEHRSERRFAYFPTSYRVNQISQEIRTTQSVVFGGEIYESRMELRYEWGAPRRRVDVRRHFHFVPFNADSDTHRRSVSNVSRREAELDRTLFPPMIR
jgi:hypothetical protein